MANARDGWMTVVIRYDDYGEFRKTALFQSVFDAAKFEDGAEPPVRVTGISHDDEMTRAELYRDAVERHRDRDDLDDAIEKIDQARRVHELRAARKAAPVEE